MKEEAAILMEQRIRELETEARRLRQRPGIKERAELDELLRNERSKKKEYSHLLENTAEFLAKQMHREVDVLGKIQHIVEANIRQCKTGGAHWADDLEGQKVANEHAQRGNRVRRGVSKTLSALGPTFTRCNAVFRKTELYHLAHISCLYT